MTYQVLARKWRPQDFSAVVGQGPIVTALRNAVGEGRIAQAYLFSGIRGVGKTSVARILAKALNCEKGPRADPCNECTTCREITRGDDLDVLEFDAATHSKVDQVRELTESLKYAPARDRYKVIILDEIHRLSRQAFDALLKIVEEPPEHLVFIFATTEAEAVPVTILSRCQEFRFRRVPLEDLADHLEMLTREEEIEASPAAIRLIARAGDGSVRDAVALLDQLATFGSGTIPDEDAARLLGGLSNEVLHGLLGAVLEGRSPDVSLAVAEIDGQGWDPRHVFGEFLGYCRSGLHLALGGDPERAELPLEEARALAELVSEAGYENLLRVLHLLLESEAAVRRSESGSLAVEVAWLRAAELPKLVRIEELLGGTGGTGGGAGAREKERPARKKDRPATAESAPAGDRGSRAPAPSKGAEAKAESESAAARPEPKPAATAKPEPAATPAAAGKPSASEPGATADRAEPEDERARQEEEPPAAAAPDEEGAAERETGHDESGSTGVPTAEGTGDGGAGEAPDRSIAAFLERISRRKQSLAAHLSVAQALEIEDGVLTIYAPPGDSWLENTLSRPSNAKLLEDALHAVWGPGISWKLAPGTADETPEKAEDEAPAETEKKIDDALEDPRVQTVLDIFGGSVESVEERGASE